jgi:hypothetical protein
MGQIGGVQDFQKYDCAYKFIGHIPGDLLEPSQQPRRSRRSVDHPATAATLQRCLS